MKTLRFKKPQRRIGISHKLKLLPAQKQKLGCEATYPLFVGGYGSGKSEALVYSALRDARANPQGMIGIFAPTYDLLDLVAIARVEETLNKLGIPYEKNGQKRIIKPQGIGAFVFRSLNHPERIVGFEVVSSHIDELDILTTKKAEESWQKVLARTRAPNKLGRNPVSVYTTPEGRGFVWEKWGKAEDPKYQLIRAKTLDNPFLNSDYVANLQSDYPPQLVKAYLEGEFVNLRTQTVYHCYDRVLNRSTKTRSNSSILHVGIDFNITNMTAIALVEIGDSLHAVDEITGAYDTRELINLIVERWYVGNRIYIYPDASSKNRSTAATETDLQLLKACKKLKVKEENRNPFVRDRVNIVNGCLLNGKQERRLLVNDELCPVLTEALENQVYDEKTNAPDKQGGYDHPLDALGYSVYSLRNQQRRGVAPSGIRIY